MNLVIANCVVSNMDLHFDTSSAGYKSSVVYLSRLELEYNIYQP